MKVSFVLCYVILFCVSGANGYSQKDTCAVLTGRPLNPDSYYTVKKILENQLNCYVKEISLETDEIATADLRNIKFLYWAGGPYFKFNPSAAAAENIRQAVARGMGYFGTCGGSLIAVETTPSSRENQLGLFPGHHPFGRERTGHENIRNEPVPSGAGAFV
jgi:hypothetical protein